MRLLIAAFLASINVNAGNPAYSSQDGVLYNKARTKLLQYPGGRSGAFTVPAGVTILGKLRFIGCVGLTSVTFPSSVQPLLLMLSTLPIPAIIA